jgi:signal transduction histidine kinase
MAVSDSRAQHRPSHRRKPSQGRNVVHLMPLQPSSTADLLHVVSAVSIDPVLIFDVDWRLKWTNAAAAALLHIAPEMTDAPVEGLQLRADLVDFILDRASLAEWTHDDMTFIPRLTSLPSLTGELAFHALVLRDVTHIRKLSHNQNEFIRVVSHDFRSPITSIAGFCSMLAKGVVGPLNPQQLGFVEKIGAGIKQLTALVENIQDAGRFDPETGFYEMQRAAVDLNDVVQRVVEGHLIPAEKEALTLRVLVSPRVPVFSADLNMLERAITNLIDNAIKFTPNGGTITVSTDADAQAAWVCVRDTGYGIPIDQQQLLFQRHVRLVRPDQKRVKGTGLGLFIVRSVAQRHGGTAWVESILNEGSAFYIRLPFTHNPRLF